ncbi:septum formation initiator family protein [Arthrobacter sp. NPDC090010]|uniref:FtsB family cell division protein n=1 Tax=Arthrobacter sp. NPDC090010 TaxID=3363942 RepID=UPI0037F3A0AC
MATRRPKVPRAHVLDGGSPAQRPARPAAASEAEIADLAAKAREKGAGQEPAAQKSRPAQQAGAQVKGKASNAGQQSASKGKAAASKASPAATGADRSTKEDQETAAPVPARAFSGRLLALGLVMLAITVLLAPTVKNWWEQRQQIAQLRSDISDQQAQQDDLKKQISRWHDPAYVQQQARDRINMVMPGETGYWVFGKDGGTAGVPSTGTADGSTAAGNTDPWTQKFLDSVREATK